MVEAKRIRPIIRHLCGRARAVDFDNGTVFDITGEDWLPISEAVEEVGGPYKKGVGRKIRVTVEAMEKVAEQ